MNETEQIKLAEGSPNRPSRRFMIWTAFAVLGICGLTVGIVLLTNAGNTNKGRSRPLSADERLVKEFLIENIKSGAKPENLEWGEPRQVLVGYTRRTVLIIENRKPEAFDEARNDYKSGLILQARWTEKGETRPKGGLFLIQHGRVARAEPVSDMDPMFGFQEFPRALAMKDLCSVAAERVNGKVTRAILRGSIVRGGVPVTEDVWVSFNREDGQTEYGDYGNVLAVAFQQEEKISQERSGRGGRTDKYAIHAVTSASHYEVSRVPVGNYLVTVEAEGKRFTLSCVVKDAQEIQTINFDLNESREKR